MAKKSRLPDDVDGNGSGHGRWGMPGGQNPRRFLVLLREEDLQTGIKAIRDLAGMKLARSGELKLEAAEAEDIAEMPEADVVFDKLGVAVVSGEPNQHQALLKAHAEGKGGILAVEPDRLVYALRGPKSDPSSGIEVEEAASQPGLGAFAAEVAMDELSLPPTPVSELSPEILQAAAGSSLTVEYLAGFRDAVSSLIERTRASALRGRIDREELPAVAAIDESQLTWGLQVTRAGTSNFTGRGVRVAVLDTGFDTSHPDFSGRVIIGRSFVQGQAVRDGNGHGTHCIGTSCGPRRPSILPGYGVASEAEIFAGKVLSNQGSGYDSWILAGMNWAIANRCRVISMSLGAPTRVGERFSPIYEAVAQRALAQRTLIVAAAGNESQRHLGIVEPVGRPANCPSIMAVAALDANLRMAWFSCGGLNPQGGQVDIAAPGVNVYSSSPMPTRYKRMSGTSMATPHVAGIAALYCQAHPRASASGIWRLLTQTARRLLLPSRDVGAGLVQAP